MKIETYNKIWNCFTQDIQAEIRDCLESGRPIKTDELFHDVMIQTDGHEISLDCVCQSYKLTSLIKAQELKDEMYSNIEWVTGLIEENYSNDEEKVRKCWNIL